MNDRLETFTVARKYASQRPLHFRQRGEGRPSMGSYPAVLSFATPPAEPRLRRCRGDLATRQRALDETPTLIYSTVDEAAHDPRDERQQWHSRGPAARTVERAQQRLVQQLIPFEARQEAGAQLRQASGAPNRTASTRRGRRRPPRSRRWLSRRQYRSAPGRTWRATAICARQVPIGTAIHKKSLPARRPITHRRHAFRYEAYGLQVIASGSGTGTRLGAARLC